MNQQRSGGGHYRNRKEHAEDQEYASLKKDIKEAKKLAELDLEYLVDSAEWFVQRYLIDIKTHQIRRFFEAVKKIEMSNSFEKTEMAKLIMLRPQLANASAKQPKLKMFTEICSLMIKKVKNKEDFGKFANFFESLVAFHKAYAKS